MHRHRVQETSAERCSFTLDCLRYCLLFRVYRIQARHGISLTLDLSVYFYPYQQHQEEYSTLSHAAVFPIHYPLMTLSFYDVVWATGKVVQHHKNTQESYQSLLGFLSDSFPREFPCKILHSVLILLSLLQIKPSVYSNKNID